MGKFDRFFKYYIKGYYHCDTCPYCWEERGMEDADAGCYIKGDIQDTCRLIPPIRFLVGWGRRKKALYNLNHQYDDYPEFIEKKEREQREVERALRDYLKTYGYGMVYASQGKAVFLNNDHEVLKEYNGIYRLTSDLRDIFYHVTYEPLKTKWKNIVKETWGRFLMIFKPYFCK